MNGVTLAFPDGLSLDAGAPPPDGRIKLGSEDHKNLFCRTLLTTFDPYKPAIIDWPKLDQETQAKITGLPIWDIAVQTEGKAGLRVNTFGEIVTDPLLKRAIELDAFEESRHKHVLANMVEAYGIKLAPEPDYIKPERSRNGPSWSPAIANASTASSPSACSTWPRSPASSRTSWSTPSSRSCRRKAATSCSSSTGWPGTAATCPCGAGPGSRSRFSRVWAFLIWERMGMGNDLANGQDNNFTVNGAQDLGVEITIPELMDICLAENDRRLGVYDKRLLRPDFVPFMVRLARRFMRTPKPAQA